MRGRRCHPARRAAVRGTDVWKQKTGKDFPSRGTSHPNEPVGKPVSEDGDDLQKRFPKLWKNLAISKLTQVRTRNSRTFAEDALEG